MVPLAEMFGYATSSSGRGTFTMKFDHYEEFQNTLGFKKMVANKLGKYLKIFKCYVKY